MKVKEDSEKVGLKLNIQKMKIMASGPITLLEIDGETVETVSDFIFWGSKITANDDCSHEIKRRLLFGRKVMTNLDSILKSRDITLPTKVRLVKAMVFPVVMYECESWAVKKAERRRIDAFELWCWRRLLRVPWTARRSNQSILKEISSGISSRKEWCWSWNSSILATSCEELTHWKRLMLGGIGGRRRRGRQRRRWLDGITDSMESEWTPGVGDGQGGLACCDSWGRKESDTTEDWTELMKYIPLPRYWVDNMLPVVPRLTLCNVPQRQKAFVKYWRKG